MWLDSVDAKSSTSASIWLANAKRQRERERERLQVYTIGYKVVYCIVVLLYINGGISERIRTEAVVSQRFGSVAATTVG